MLRCLIYKVHAAPSRREFILPSRFPLVKPFFQVFQNFFRGFFKRGPIRLTPRPPSRTTCLYYHLFLVLSSTFFKSFSICFVLNFALEGSFLPPSRTAYVGYHTPSPLSSTFFLFFAFFLQRALFFLFVRVWRTFLHEILSCTTTAIMIPLNLSLRYYI